jgi:DNA invertase Pin-like site-specific DNA recombinase
MNTDLKTAAAYIRVSTDNQTEISPDSQIKVVRQYAKQHGYIIPNEFVFRDDGISGRHADKRPEFNSMIAAAKQKPSPFSAVLLWKFSRFARNQEESIFYKSMLRKNGVEVISVSEPIIDGPFGSLIERIIEWSDEYYSIRLSGEVKRSMTLKVEKGQPVVAPPYGYDIENKKYIINPEKASYVKMIFNDFLSGMPVKKIAEKLNALGLRTKRGNLWENRTVEYILYNPVYTGKIRWNPKRRIRRDYNDPDTMITDGGHEPIIDSETFEKAQELLAERKKKFAKYSHDTTPKYNYMLHGLVKCSSCGATLSATVKCTSLQCCKYIRAQCLTSHSITLEKLNPLVLNTIEAAFKTGNFELTVKNTNNVPGITEIDINALIKKEQQKYGRIKEAYENGVYTVEELAESKRITDERIADLKKRLKPQNKTKQLKKKLVEKYKDVLPVLRNPEVSEQEKNEILRSFVDKIIFNRPNSTIQIFFYT